MSNNEGSEIILRGQGLCNLTEIVVRADDTKETLMEKMRIATILGTIQASYTDFKYVRPIWRKNAEEEALLGVSLTGIMDNPFTNKPSEELKVFLNDMRDYSVEVNKSIADKLGINPAMATTAIKPLTELAA